MLDDSSRGNPGQNIDSLSVEEVALWFPNIAEVLEDLGVHRADAKASLKFLCDEAGVETALVCDILSGKVQKRLDAAIEVEKLSIIGGCDKNGRAERIPRIDICPGEVIALLGPTGSGKSQLLYDIESLTSGDSVSKRKILLNDRLYADIVSPQDLIRPVAHISQNMNFLLDLRVSEFLDMHIKVRRIDDGGGLKHEIIDIARALCGEPFSLDDQIVSLSGGQSRALMIADVVMVSKSPILLIDEIENAGIQKDRAIEFLIRRKTITLLATHDPILALRANRRIVFRNGSMTDCIRKTAEEDKMLRKLVKMENSLMETRDHLRNGGVFSAGEARKAVAGKRRAPPAIGKKRRHGKRGRSKKPD